MYGPGIPCCTSCQHIVVLSIVQELVEVGVLAVRVADIGLQPHDDRGRTDLVIVAVIVPFHGNRNVDELGCMLQGQDATGGAVVHIVHIPNIPVHAVVQERIDVGGNR